MATVTQDKPDAMKALLDGTSSIGDLRAPNHTYGDRGREFGEKVREFAQGIWKSIKSGAARVTGVTLAIADFVVEKVREIRATNNMNAADAKIATAMGRAENVVRVGSHLEGEAGKFAIFSAASLRAMNDLMIGRVSELVGTELTMDAKGKLDLSGLPSETRGLVGLEFQRKRFAFMGVLERTLDATANGLQTIAVMKQQIAETTLSERCRGFQKQLFADIEADLKKLMPDLSVSVAIDAEAPRIGKDDAKSILGRLFAMETKTADGRSAVDAIQDKIKEVTALSTWLTKIDGTLASLDNRAKALAGSPFADKANTQVNAALSVAEERLKQYAAANDDQRDAAKAQAILAEIEPLLERAGASLAVLEKGKIACDQIGTKSEVGQVIAEAAASAIVQRTNAVSDAVLRSDDVPSAQEKMLKFVGDSEAMVGEIDQLASNWARAIARVDKAASRRENWRASALPDANAKLDARFKDYIQKFADNVAAAGVDGQQVSTAFTVFNNDMEGLMGRLNPMSDAHLAHEAKKAVDAAAAKHERNVGKVKKVGAKDPDAIVDALLNLMDADQLRALLDARAAGTNTTPRSSVPTPSTNGATSNSNGVARSQPGADSSAPPKTLLGVEQLKGPE